MTEITGWRRLIGHRGTFLATLDLWSPERAGRTRHLQPGFRALWSLEGANGEPAIQEGPLDLVEARSLAPGSTGNVLIHPMWPEAWRGVDAGATLTLLSRSRHRRVIGEATVLERRGVPASAPPNLEPFEETPARARLRAVAGAPPARSVAAPPTVTVGTVTLPLLSSSWGDPADRHENAPRSRTEEADLAARLPTIRLDRGAPVLMTVTDADLAVSGEIAYFSGIDPDGIPAGDRLDVHRDSRSLLRGVERVVGGAWSLRIPAPGGAKAVVVSLTFAPGAPAAPANLASWGFRLP
ncbi:hypothetical protein [Georgenia sp. SYP-B2076]|uniref:hypothetical protein n=1 Tax=Georgenia sp. SYP-B2076 TaxID=2495881 RepID=UPI000F8D5BC1|nr:hypothetical protein [Georgenia sp. SYP-B2076]